MDVTKRLNDAHAVRLAAGLTGYALKIPAEDILSASQRDHRIARARQVAMYLSHVGLGMSLARIASALGRDRSTVAHGCHRIEDFRDDADVDRWLEGLEEQLRVAAGVETGQGGRAAIPSPFQPMPLS